MIAADYGEEFCVSPSFDSSFVSALMGAGFLVMSARMPAGPGGGQRAILLPKLHRTRSVLDFPRLHASRSAERLIPRYDLRPNADFDTVLRNCAAVHGEDWLTAELMACFRDLGVAGRMASFALYREGRLVAGEFGALAGGVYTSYSGYYAEASAGTVQLVLTGRWLRDAGYAFWDLGMPMEYKARLGARDLETGEFIERFRAARTAVRRAGG